MKLESPNTRSLNLFKKWMSGNICLTGDDQHVWSEKILLAVGQEEKDNPHFKDLITLKPRNADDAFTNWIFDTVVDPYHWYIGHWFKKPENGDPIVEYKDKKIVGVAKKITIVVACLLPVVSIVILYYIESLKVRLGTLAALTAVFAVCMELFTGADMPDIFAATAGFTAVCVVFVGSTAVVGAA